MKKDQGTPETVAQMNLIISALLNILTGVSGMLTIALVVFVVTCKTRNQKGALAKLKATASPINICLLTMSISLVITCAMEAMFFSSTDVQVTVDTSSISFHFKLLNLARSWAIGVFKVTYLEYSYFRTVPIVMQDFPGAVTLVFVSVQVSATLLIVPSLFSTIAIWIDLTETQVDVRDHISVASYVMLFLVDAGFLALFVKCLQSSRDMVQPDPQFLIISRYGIAAACVFSAIIPFSYLYVIEGPEYYFCMCIVLFIATYIVLFGMKLALYKDSVRSQQVLRRRVEAIRQEGQGLRVFSSQETVALVDAECKATT
ncbi:hypothetical protein HDU84_000894 [Entophlyctis sp. JEL0112]|nr:hypothetical protein HDU84_000894 [Entophlyctis sp. JEL0112]